MLRNVLARVGGRSRRSTVRGLLEPFAQAPGSARMGLVELPGQRLQLSAVIAVDGTRFFKGRVSCVLNGDVGKAAERSAASGLGAEGRG